MEATLRGPRVDPTGPGRTKAKLKRPRPYYCKHISFLCFSRVSLVDLMLLMPLDVSVCQCRILKQSVVKRIHLEFDRFVENQARERPAP